MALSTKRKRAQVSYTEENDELDMLLDISEQENVTEISDDEDITYGSRKRLQKRNGAQRRKKAKTVTRSKLKKDEKPFPFLSLPPELRDYIYELALTDRDGISLIARTINLRRTVVRGLIPKSPRSGYHQRYAPTHDANLDSGKNQLVPALLAVNKQIYSETVGWLYNQPFAIQDMFALHSFLAILGSHRSCLTNVKVCGWGQGRGTHKAMNFCALTLLADCTNLKSLHLDCIISHVRKPKELARQIYRDGTPFLIAYGAANGRKDAAVDILRLHERNFDRKYTRYGRSDELPEKDVFKKLYAAELRKLLAG